MCIRGSECHSEQFMKLFIVAAFTITVSTAVPAAEPSMPPTHSIAVKKELLFGDDFEGSAPAKVWHKVVPTFVVENGTLKGTQTRDKDVPNADGKTVIKAHAAVHGLRSRPRTASSKPRFASTVRR